MQKIARRRVAAYIADQLEAGTPVKHLVRQTVAYLQEQRQLGQVELLIRDVEQVLEQRYGVVTASVTTARPTAAATEAGLQRFIKEVTGAKQVIISSQQTDADLIGGVIVQTASRTFDGSVSRQLKQLAAVTKG